MKKIIAMIILGFTILALFVPTNAMAAETFSDIKGHWSENSIKEMVEKKIVNGYPDGTFKTDNSLKFEEFVKMVVVAVSDEEIGVSNGMFWYENYMNAALKNKYIDEQMLLNIGKNIDRKTMAEILYRVIENNEGVEKYSDSEFRYMQNALKDLSSQDKNTLTIAGMGIICGYPDETFKPNNSLTRAETVTVIYRLIDKSMRVPIETAPVTPMQLEDLPPVDLNHLYDYPTLSGIPVKEQNETYYKYGVDFMETIVNDAATYMELANNRDYTTINDKAEKYKSDLLYYLNGYKEYKGIEYYGLRSYSLSLQNNSIEYIEYLNNRNDFITDFLNKLCQDTIDNKVKVQAKFYTNENLLIYSDGGNAVRGTLRIKYENHDNPENIKEEIDLVKREEQAKGQRMASLDKSRYNIYMDFDKIPQLKVGQWYDIDVDVVLFHTSTAKGLTERAKRSYRYIYPIAIREVK